MENNILIRVDLGHILCGNTCNITELSSFLGDLMYKVLGSYFVLTGFVC